MKMSYNHYEKQFDCYLPDGELFVVSEEEFQEEFDNMVDELTEGGDNVDHARAVAFAFLTHTEEWEGKR